MKRPERSLACTGSLACTALLLAVAWLQPVAAHGQTVALAADVSPARAPADADPRSSEALLSPVQAWSAAGFRLQLGYLYGGMAGWGGAPSAQSHAVAVRAGLRLDRDFSLLGHLQYALVTGGMLGARYLGTLEPTWHPANGLEVGLGVGFGGLVEGRGARLEQDAALRDELVASYTYPSATPAMAQCMGSGVAALLRTAWLRPLGQLGAVGLQAQVDGQWTLCQDNLGRVEPDTARPIVRRQWWPHTGGSIGVVFAWR